MSASRRPTRPPISLRAHARLADTVDLPTPPLHDDTAMIEPTFARAGGTAAREPARDFSPATTFASPRPYRGIRLRKATLTVASAAHGTASTLEMAARQASASEALPGWAPVGLW